MASSADENRPAPAVLPEQAATEGVMAVIERGDMAEQVVRHAARLAAALHAPLIAFHTEINPTGPSVQPALDLALQLGGTIDTASGTDTFQHLLEAADRQNVAIIVIGREKRRQIPFVMPKALWARLAAYGTAFSVHVVSTPETTIRPPVSKANSQAIVGSYLTPIALVAAAAIFGVFARHVLPRDAMGFIFIAIIAGAASRFGVWPGLVTAVGSFLVWNFFFLPPVFTFSVGDPRDVVALAVFLGLGLLTGTLAGRVRLEAEAARGRIEALRRIAIFGRRLAAATDEASLRDAVETEAAALAGSARLVLAGLDGRLLRDSGLETKAQAAAELSFRSRIATGAGTAALSAVPWRFIPLANGDATLGVLGVRPEVPLTAPALQALGALADQAALALDRLRLTAKAADARALETTQRLRSALLSSLSHDLRTPLTSIRGAAETLSTGLSLPEATRADLLRAIVQETSRMTRFLANITGMARIETGEIVARREVVPLGPTIEAAIGRVPDAFHAGVRCEVAAVTADPALLEQVLVNLLENAVKYTSAGAAITVSARPEDDAVAISVADEGVGIAKEELTRVFDSFFRAGRGDRIAPGTGLGLAIARAFVEVMGGTIKAESPRSDLPRDGSPGTIITFRLPAAQHT